MSEEANRFRCPACGAPAEADALQCTYCKAQLSTVSCPRCFAAVSRSAHFCGACGAPLVEPQAEAGPPLPCPACATPMPRRTVGQTSIHACEACGGLWLEGRVLDTLVASEARREALLAGLPEERAPGVGEIRYRACPECQKFMNRVNYAKVSKVIVDVCRDHGTWFDRDELRRVLAFIDQGGLEKARAREIQDLQMEKARLQVRVEGGGVPMGGTWGQEEEDGLLFRSIFKLLN